MQEVVLAFFSFIDFHKLMLAFFFSENDFGLRSALHVCSDRYLRSHDYALIVEVSVFCRGSFQPMCAVILSVRCFQLVGRDPLGG